MQNKKIIIYKPENNQVIYINPQVISYFNQAKIILKTSDSIIINDMSKLNDSKLILAVTSNQIEAFQLNQNIGCDICFVNNHKNDCIDFTPTYEISSETVPYNLQKVLTKHQKYLKKKKL